MERAGHRARDGEVSAWPPAPPRPPSPPPPPPPPEYLQEEETPWGEFFNPYGDDPEALGDDPWKVSPWEDEEGAAEGDGDEDDVCGCGGEPPPVFNLPPPPPMPKVVKEGEEEEGSGCDAPLPSETCPALLVAGGAQTHTGLQPPIAALVVAAATLTLVAIIAALVCWRYRRQRGRRGPSKSSSDLTNGVIYEDLPSGPAPRVIPGHALPHDTHTLAPMELLDMKLSPHAHTTSYGGADTTTPSLLHQYQPPVALTGAAFTHEHPTPSPPYSPKRKFEPQRSTRSSQELYNPTYEEISGAAVDGLSVSPSGSDTTSVSSASVSSEGGEVGSRDRIAEGPGPPTPAWSGGGSCTSCGRRASGGRRGTRGGRARKPRPTGSATSTGTTEGSEYHEGILSQLLPPHAMVQPRHPLPYTIHGTSDGRTSTSSSSDLPVDRYGAPLEPRYYVGVPAMMARSPATPDACTRGLPSLAFTDSMEGSSGTPSTSGGERPSPTERGLPPLPSRSDRYRIYFTTERRRGGDQHHPQPAVAARTLDPARKRQRRYDSRDTLENEPLYHEL